LQIYTTSLIKENGVNFKYKSVNESKYDIFIEINVKAPNNTQFDLMTLIQKENIPACFNLYISYRKLYD